MRSIPRVLATVAVAFSCSSSLVIAQGSLPRLLVPAQVFFVAPSNVATLSVDVSGRPGAAFVVFADVSGGPVDLFGVRFQLGLTRALVTVDSGRLPSWGQQLDAVSVPFSPGIAGVPLHLQAVVLNAAVPNGMFDLSNGESSVLLQPTASHVERFDDAGLEGFTGTFDPSIRDRIQGGAVRVRMHRTVDPQGVPFGLPISTPLNHLGARAQLCYRTQDVGATGEAELVTAIRWRLFGSQLTSDRFDQFELLLSHSDVVPDFTIDPWTALPQFPGSGLDPVFANNVKPGETPQSVYSGAYAIGPADLRPDGYVDYPIARPFAYNGVDSLLLDLRMTPSTVPGSGANGQIIRLMVQSSAQPNARVVAYGRFGQTVDPNTVRQGVGDNAMHDYQIEFTRVRTTAESPWRAARISAPDYQVPIVAKVEPAGTTVTVEYRGADDALGSNPTAWSANIDLADGKDYLQYRFTFVGDAATSEVSAIDSLVVPYR